MFDARDLWAAVILSALLGLAIGGLLGSEAGKGNIRRKAIDHGAAHWVCDPATGETKFEWNGEE